MVSEILFVCNIDYVGPKLKLSSVKILDYDILELLSPLNPCSSDLFLIAD